MPLNSQTFRKSERLCSKKAIAGLFENGRSFYSFPFQIIWTNSGSEIPSPAQVAISVSKKTFRRAVRRNLIKRRIREAYRKNKYLLYEFLEARKIHIVFIFIYKDNIMPDYAALEKAVTESLQKLISDISRQPAC